MKFFYFMARTFSYTFAVSFYTIIIGLIASVFGLFLGSSFIIFSYDKLLILIIKWLPVSALIASLIHYVQFGFLTPIGVPAFLKSHREINNAFRANLNVKDEDLPAIYARFCDLTMHNTVASVVYSALTGFILLALLYYQYSFNQTVNIQEMKILFRIVILSTIIVMILYGMSTYLLSESLTNNERAVVYNQLLRKGIKTPPHVLIGIRVKFMFFVVLTVITLFTFAALMEKSRYFEEYNFTLIMVYFGISIVAAFYLMQITTRSILRILGDMRRVTREIASGGRTAFSVLSLEREFAAIEFALMEMAWEIDEYRKDLEGKVDQRTNELQNALTDLEGRDTQIQKQLDMASVIQRSILPGIIEDWNEVKFATRYLAMEKIGGDFYDVHQLRDNKLGIVIADVSGHGIPAALVTTMAKISFGNAGSRFDSPRRIFQEVNQNILDHVKTQDYMTCFMVAIDDEYNITYSNASHQKAILLRTNRGEIELLDTNGLFLGAIEDARDTYEEKLTRLEYRDRLVLYTDGIPEAVNNERNEYSNNRLENAVLQYRELPLEEFATAIIDDVERHIGGAPIEDDITLFVVELARDEAVEIIKGSKKMIELHQYNEAIEVLENGMLKYPENQKILYNLGKNYFRINNYGKAAELLNKYLEHDHRNKYAYYIGGSAYFMMLDYKTAVDYFDRAIDLDSSFTNALFAQGMAFKKMEDYEQAKKLFQRVISIEPENKMALYELKTIEDISSKSK